MCQSFGKFPHELGSCTAQEKRFLVLAWNAVNNDAQRQAKKR